MTRRRKQKGPQPTRFGLESRREPAIVANIATLLRPFVVIDSIWNMFAPPLTEDPILSRTELWPVRRVTSPRATK